MGFLHSKRTYPRLKPLMSMCVCVCVCVRARVLLVIEVGDTSLRITLPHTCIWTICKLKINKLKREKHLSLPPPQIQTKMWSENRNEVLQARHVLVIVWEGEACQSNVIYCRYLHQGPHSDWPTSSFHSPLSFLGSYKNIFYNTIVYRSMYNYIQDMCKAQS